MEAGRSEAQGHPGLHSKFEVSLGYVRLFQYNNWSFPTHVHLLVEARDLEFLGSKISSQISLPRCPGKVVAF